MWREPRAKSWALQTLCASLYVLRILTAISIRGTSLSCHRSPCSRLYGDLLVRRTCVMDALVVGVGSEKQLCPSSRPVLCKSFVDLQTQPAYRHGKMINSPAGHPRLEQHMGCPAYKDLAW